MIRWHVEVRYPKSSDWEVIAIFDKEIDANMYAARHNGAGGGVLRVFSRDCDEHLQYEIRVIYGQPKPNSISFPVGVSFRYECEALAFASRNAICKSGYSVVRQQRHLAAVS